MEIRDHARTAVLLASYNGARYVEAQIRSLTQNKTPFTLHWLDDKSTDQTCEIVRAEARRLGINLREWHHPQHQGYVSAFFHLLERADADIYLFCDQDDIWQPGKIDATVSNLIPDIQSPVLCFSDALVFSDDKPDLLQRLTDFRNVCRGVCFQDSRAFMYLAGMGNTIGFTRPLRELFLCHKEIAREYAVGHDFWMLVLARAVGTARALSDAPTTLYRLHGNNVFGMTYNMSITRAPSIAKHAIDMWRHHQRQRKQYSRNADGFVRAARTLPAGSKLKKQLEIARRVATLHRRQSPAEVFRLVRLGAMPPIKERAFWFSVTCLFSHAGR